jgi:predicted glycosyltransferase
MQSPNEVRQPWHRDPRFTIVTDCGLTFKKGSITILEAFHKVKKTRNDFKLVVCGKSDDKMTHLKTSLDALCESGLAEYAGWVSSSQFNDYLELSDLYVSASSGEGCSNSLNHALASGIEVFSTPVGAVQEFMNRGIGGVDLFPVDDADRLVNLVSARLELGRTVTQRHDRNTSLGEIFNPEREKTQWEDILRSLTPKPSVARTEQQYRILFFTHDGSGLGHLRRLTRISESMQGPCSCLFVSGHGEMSWMVPPSSEFINLPSHDRILRSKSRYWGREPFWQEDEKTSLAFRNEILNAVFNAYNPHAIIVDYLPLGKYDELSNFITTGQCKKYLIWRGILDILPMSVQMCSKEERERALHNAYDRIFVCCDPRVINLEQEYRSGPEIGAKLSYVGYVAPAYDPSQRTKVRQENCVPESCERVVCSAGGGKFGEDIIGECQRIARKRPEVRFDIVYGPRTALYWPHGLANRVQDGNLALWRECHCLPDLHMHADVVVCPGGYNSTHYHPVSD